MINYNPNIKKKINKSKILIIDNFLEKKLYQNIAAEIKKLKKKRKCEKVFIFKKKIIKEEFNNYNYFYKNQKKLIKLICSKRFEIFLKNNFNIKYSLFPEKSNMFSGFNIAKKGSYLRPHADFNFNSKMKKFRTINLLLYFNNNWKKKNGGNLLFYNYRNTKRKIEIIARKNRAVIFLTNKYSIHGYNVIKTNKLRVSLNFYFYTNKNLSFDKKPHKTLWR